VCVFMHRTQHSPVSSFVRSVSSKADDSKRPLVVQKMPDELNFCLHCCGEPTFVGPTLRTANHFLSDAAGSQNVLFQSFVWLGSFQK
jgi:hypothetical protein